MPLQLVKLNKYISGDASKNVILDCTHISGLDFTAVQGIIELEADFIRHNAIFALACAKVRLKFSLFKQ